MKIIMTFTLLISISCIYSADIKVNYWDIYTGHYLISPYVKQITNIHSLVELKNSNDFYISMSAIKQLSEFKDAYAEKELIKEFFSGPYYFTSDSDKLFHIVAKKLAIMRSLEMVNSRNFPEFLCDALDRYMKADLHSYEEIITAISNYLWKYRDNTTVINYFSNDSQKYVDNVELYKVYYKIKAEQNKINTGEDEIVYLCNIRDNISYEESRRNSHSLRVKYFGITIALKSYTIEEYNAAIRNFQNILNKTNEEYTINKQVKKHINFCMYRIEEHSRPEYVIHERRSVLFHDSRTNMLDRIMPEKARHEIRSDTALSVTNNLSFQMFTNAVIIKPDTKLRRKLDDIIDMFPYIMTETNLNSYIKNIFYAEFAIYNTLDIRRRIVSPLSALEYNNIFFFSDGRNNDIYDFSRGYAVARNGNSIYYWSKYDKGVITDNYYYGMDKDKILKAREQYNFKTENVRN